MPTIRIKQPSAPQVREVQKAATMVRYQELMMRKSNSFRDSKKKMSQYLRNPKSQPTTPTRIFEPASSHHKFQIQPVQLKNIFKEIQVQNDKMDMSQIEAKYKVCKPKVDVNWY